jgi:hypothetical protein
MRKEFQERLATEYRYAVGKMQEANQPAKKLFYFSVSFGEAQRVLNWEWDADLALIYELAHQTHTQINASIQVAGPLQTLPVDWQSIFDRLTRAFSDLATYFEQNNTNKDELCRILGRFAEISYAVTGNGSYLYEKGLIKF